MMNETPTPETSTALAGRDSSELLCTGKSASQLLEESAGPFDAACMMVRRMEDDIAELAKLVVDVYQDKRFEALDDEIKNRVRVSVLKVYRVT